MSNPALTAFFLDTPPAVVLLELLEIDHPVFANGPYRIVRNAVRGLDPGVTHEDATGPHVYEYYPAEIRPAGIEGNNLLQSLRVSLGDLSEIIQPEISRLTERSGMQIEPTCTFRLYSSADLTTPLSVLALEIRELTTGAEGASFVAQAPEANESGVGEKYLTSRFPMLRAYL